MNHYCHKNTVKRRLLAVTGARMVLSAAMVVSGLVLGAGDDAASAMAFYQRAQAKMPDWPEPYRRIGETGLALGLPEQAAAAYTRLAELTPEDASAHLGLGRTLIALDRPADALKAFEAAKAAAPKEYPRPQRSLGIARDLMGDHAAAQALYRDGLLVLAPDSISLKSNLRLSLALAGDFTQAIEVLGAAAKDPPAAGPRTRQNLALVYGLAGDMARTAAIGRLDLSEAQVASNLKRYEALRNLSDKARAWAVHTGQTPDG